MVHNSCVIILIVWFKSIGFINNTDASWVGFLFCLLKKKKEIVLLHVQVIVDAMLLYSGYVFPALFERPFALPDS